MREGDALETVKTIDGPVGFVLLDGWKEFYVRDPANGYVSVEFAGKERDTMEIQLPRVTLCRVAVAETRCETRPHGERCPTCRPDS